MDGVCSGLTNYNTFDLIFCEVGNFSKSFFDLFIRESVPFFLTTVIFVILFFPQLQQLMGIQLTQTQ